LRLAPFAGLDVEFDLAGGAQAGRPLSTDDAGVIPQGECQVESWYQSADGAHETHLAPGCGIGHDTEFDAEAIHLSPAVDDRDAFVVQLKTALPTLDAYGWSFAAKLNAGAVHPAGGNQWRSDAYSATGIATHHLGDDLDLHLNLGAERRQRERITATTYAAALVWNAAPQALLFAEVLGDDKAGATQTLGARWWLQPERIGLDLTVGRQAGVPDSRFVTVGLCFYGLGR